MTAASPPAARVANADAALFVSDMHLDDTQPELTGHVLAGLDARIERADRTVPGGIAGGGVALFLLGDLFEFWVGDDHLTRAAVALANRLEAFVARGGRAFLMRGNRDFLLDVPLPATSTAPFSAACSATLLTDPAVIEVDGRRVVLSHGDALCVADTAYQQWRALCRSSRWQQQLLARPLSERIAMALELRARSNAAQEAATETLSDVDEDAAGELLAAQAADLLVHGHTHRPGRHRWKDPRGRSYERWVLSDWSAEPRRGAVMSLAEGMALPVTRTAWEGTGQRKASSQPPNPPGPSRSPEPSR